MQIWQPHTRHVVLGQYVTWAIVEFSISRSVLVSEAARIR